MARAEQLIAPGFGLGFLFGTGRARFGLQFGEVLLSGRDLGEPLQLLHDGGARKLGDVQPGILRPAVQFLRDRDVHAIHAHIIHTHAMANIEPGLNRLFGSRADLMERCTPRATGPIPRASQSRWPFPTPCPPATVPPSPRPTPRTSPKA